MSVYDRAYNEILWALGDPLDRLEDLRRRGIFDQIEEIRPIIGFGGHGSGHKDLWEHTKRVVQNVADRGLSDHVRWAALFHDVGKPECVIRNKDGDIAFHGHEWIGAKMTDRFFELCGFPVDDAVRVVVPKIVELLGDVEGYSPSWSDSAVRRLSKKFGDISVEDVTVLAACDCTSKHREKCEKYAGYATELRDRILALREADARLPALPTGLGTTLTERFFVKGRRLGQLMNSLKTLVEQGSLPRSVDHEVYVAYVVGFEHGVSSAKESE